MIIRKFTIDGDMMSAHNLVAEVNEELQKYGLSLVVEDEEHDGYDVVILSDNKPEPDPQQQIMITRCC